MICCFLSNGNFAQFETLLAAALGNGNFSCFYSERALTSNPLGDISATYYPYICTMQHITVCQCISLSLFSLNCFVFLTLSHISDFSFHFHWIFEGRWRFSLVVAAWWLIDIVAKSANWEDEVKLISNQSQHPQWRRDFSVYVPSDKSHWSVWVKSLGEHAVLGIKIKSNVLV